MIIPGTTTTSLTVTNVFVGVTTGTLFTMQALFIEGANGDVLYTGYSSEVKTTSYPYTIGFIM
jgi:hypothetical protein